MVRTNPGGPGIHDNGADLDSFADSVYSSLPAKEEEIGLWYTRGTADRTRREMEEAGDDQIDITRKRAHEE